jgi:putative DNA primase/helicase
LVCAFEGSGSLKLSEERLKGIASGDRSSSRGLFKEEREYAATFKVALVTNDRPVVRGDDDALWRRLRVVPLAHKVPEESVDPELRSRLQQDPDVRGAVLAWLVEGWRLYREQGLKASEEVRLASDAYRGAVDRVHAFISASLIVEHGSFASNDGLRDALQAWNEENEEQVQRADVITSLKKNGCVSDTARACGKSVRGWRGVRFISDRPRTAHQAPAGLRDQ